MLKVLVAQLYSTLATPWTLAHQALLFMGFSRQEYWSGLPFPSPGNFPHPGIVPGSPALQADSLPWKPDLCIKWITNENLLYSTGNSTQ